MKPIKLVPDDTKIDFMKGRYVAFAFTLFLMAAAIFGLVTKGLNFGIDFTGGTLIEIRLAEEPNLSDLRSTLNQLGLGDIQLQEFGQERDLLIRMAQQEGGPEEQQAAINRVRDTLNQRYGEAGVEFRRTEFVGPQVGEELKRQGLMAVLLALGGILAYIWFRFEWHFAAAAIATTAHDALFIVGMFALMQWQFDLSTVAAVLMITGYSINDTVVVFDRVRENLRKFKKMPLVDLLNLSINQMLNRSLMTSLTTVLAMLALWLLGGEVIRGFVNALVIGIALGTYSSIFVAAPMLMYLRLRPSRQQATEEDAV